MRFRGTVFRGHHPKWSWDPESGEGARLHGGRFNPRGVDALYTSLRPETAWLEAQAGFAAKAQPLLLCAYDADCDGVLDLTDAATLAAQGIVPADLACAWEDQADRGEVPPSWRIAARLRMAGLAGIIVPSLARGATAADRNLALWRWSREPPQAIRVIDDFARLPRDAASWP